VTVNLNRNLLEIGVVVYRWLGGGVRAAAQAAGSWRAAAAAGARAAAGRPHKKRARTWASPSLPTCTMPRRPADGFFLT
jgi:hypothetical protein